MEVEGKSADEGTAVSFGRRGEVVLREFGLDKGVDGGIGGEVLEGLPSPVTETAVFFAGEGKGKQAKE